MKKRYRLFFIFGFFVLQNNMLFAQGVSRSTGIGIRAGFWNIGGGSSLRIAVDAQGSQIDVSGMGGYLYFFSRMYKPVFFEISAGAIGAVEVVSDQNNSRVSVKTLTPLLFGLRYDLFSTRISGPVHPYIAAGGGPYLTMLRQTGESDQDVEIVNVESKIYYGWYLGGGANIPLTSWFGFNFDLKYHMVEFGEVAEFKNGYEFGMGCTAMWGRKQEIFRITGVRLLVPHIYPAYQRFYSSYPIALVSVQNLIGHPIEVNVRCNIKGYSERPKETGYIRVGKREIVDIPVTVFLSQKIYRVENSNTAILDLEVKARTGKLVSKQISEQIVIHSHNAWNGEMDKLSFFLTPDNREVLETGRKMLDLNEVDAKNLLAVGRLLFDCLKEKGIVYRSDPNIPFYQDDRVQFAAETLKLGSGDCDDLVILYASFLQSVGIFTAFVEVEDPEKNLAHLYLLFDTGVAPQEGYIVSSNEKKYIVRENNAGQETLWIPVETTLLENGFEDAWNAAATAWLQEAVLRNGLVEGWVRIIDTL
ncbi:hypothetical protein JW935_16315 [candidate division KSB1 bacterium]|nr:hypothetical protein [candidate division KSB1 bacterium]